MKLCIAKSKKAYKFWDTSLNKVVLWKDVLFEETNSEDKSTNAKLDHNKQVRFKDLRDIINEPKPENTNVDAKNGSTENSFQKITHMMTAAIKMMALTLLTAKLITI